MLKKVSAALDSSPPEPRLYLVVAERIKDLIRDERLQPGARLPSERELATRLSLSRASLREALIALELGGLVEVRSGSGVYIAHHQSSSGASTGTNGGAPAADEGGPGPFEVLSARRLIEGEVCAIAARMATDSAIDAILAAVEAMERHHDNIGSNEQADRNFHLAIARATGNSAFVGMVDYLWQQRGRLWHKLKEHFQTEELRQETLKDHRRILAAIVAHDPAAARSAMRAHLERVTRTFSRG